ncbi:MAG: DUF2497 domain-containing protein [Rubritepida sp.]|nr:DUF2497 domain-containing protein [Rubritepida sp.]
MSGTPTPPGAGGEPSMDDILASIRKILNEDEAAVPPAAAEPAPAAAPEATPVLAEPPADAPLELTPEMMIAPPVAEPAPALAPEALMAGGLVAPAAAAAAAAAFGELSRAVAMDRGAGIARSGGLTIEDVVREELRPLLKAWLDAHLPPLVERLVRAEIERVMSRAG